MQQPTRRPRIAIAGATGRVGSVLTSLLTSDPVDIVVLTRRPEQAQAPPGVEIVAIDFEHPKTIEDALCGVDRLFIAHGTSAQQIAHEIALINRAVAAGIGHVVKLSVLGPPTRLVPYSWHMEIEAHLARQPVASTVLRPSVFVDILKRFADQISAGHWTGAAGNGRVNFVDTRDVANVARIALLEEVEPTSQRAYHLTGPRAWSMQQLAEEFSRLLGHPVLYHHRSPEEQRSELISAGAAPFVADLLVGLDQMFRESVHGETTSTVEDMTGVAARNLPEWITENADVFREVERVGGTPSS